jgi:hypothetical protein
MWRKNARDDCQIIDGQVQELGRRAAFLSYAMSRINCFYLDRYCRYRVGLARARVSKYLDNWFDPPASEYYAELSERGFSQVADIDVLPQHRILYLWIPKCASTTIRMALSAMNRRAPASSEQVHMRRYSGLKSPKQVGPSTFYRIVNDPAALRFSFVRNPYDRVVSAWADKFQNKPLVTGDPFVEKYLKWRKAMNYPRLDDADQTLSFVDFVHFASATSDRRIDPHWQLQDDILNIPGIRFDFIGKVESFSLDFIRVCEHVGADPAMAAAANGHFNKSQRQVWRDYYTSALADQIYRAYERDFDRLLYPRAV